MKRQMGDVVAPPKPGVYTWTCPRFFLPCHCSSQVISLMALNVKLLELMVITP